MRFLMISALLNHRWVWRWKNFENRSTFEVMGKKQSGCFYLNTVRQDKHTIKQWNSTLNRKSNKHSSTLYMTKSADTQTNKINIDSHVNRVTNYVYYEFITIRIRRIRCRNPENPANSVIAERHSSGGAYTRFNFDSTVVRLLIKVTKYTVT